MTRKISLNCTLVYKLHLVIYLGKTKKCGLGSGVASICSARGGDENCRPPPLTKNYVEGFENMCIFEIFLLVQKINVYMYFFACVRMYVGIFEAKIMMRFLNFKRCHSFTFDKNYCCYRTTRGVPKVRAEMQ